eukprot:CAMPEP_0198449632 /NCGR_PEP_ID=MMETSP1453-20131121/4424_1 /TAXON_ID=1461543 ORGANISM="Unidentified sp., Strain RCC701" /NCGR_SAMPLE_ID=MMETSP1453 /ASSEMBLY_ACC=CAM_ASM_001118 /LENGTH=86 /DNA_ID=CAMNT_0044172479 /DNA_START=47 /DNA_END=304 /DNA_ORIENTATION=+
MKDAKQHTTQRSAKSLSHSPQRTSAALRLDSLPPLPLPLPPPPSVLPVTRPCSLPPLAPQRRFQSKEEAGKTHGLENGRVLQFVLL